MYEKHILITGAPGTGKSTLIRKICRAMGVPVSGFCTKKAEPDADGMSPVYLFPAGEENPRSRFVPGNLVARVSPGGAVAFPEAFDRLGVPLLSRPDPDGIIVMDELGRLEKDALLFRQAVLDRLHGEIPVIAAVKDLPGIPFLDQVRRMPSARIFRIDPACREELTQMLLGRAEAGEPDGFFRKR